VLCDPIKQVLSGTPDAPTVSWMARRRLRRACAQFCRRRPDNRRYQQKGKMMDPDIGEPLGDPFWIVPTREPIEHPEQPYHEPVKPPPEKVPA